MSGRRPLILRYGFALALALAAGGLRASLDPLWGTSLPFVFFFPAIVVAAWFGGFGPGLLTTFSGAVITWSLWLAPGATTAGVPSMALGLGVFLGSGAGVSVLCQALLDSRGVAQREVEEARTANARLSVAQAFADAGVWDWDLVTGQLYWSAEYYALFGLPQDTKPSLEVFVGWVVDEDRARLAKEVEAVLDGGAEKLDVVFRVPTKENERRRYLRAVGRVERDANGRPTRIAGISIDVTDTVEARDALRASEERLRETSEAKDALIAMLSHELRNPVHAIASAAAIQERAVDGPAAERAREIVARQVRHLERILADMLDVTHAVSGKIIIRREPVELSRLTRECLDALRATGRTADHDVRVDVEPVWVDGDPTRLDQVVTNLVTNAVKYTQAGKEIRIVLRHEGESAVLRVHDAGAGMTPELLSRAFEPFVQGEQTLDRSQGGLGVGLALVQRIVELHGGTVTAESAGPGKGSTFVVRLRARNAVEARASREMRAAKVKRRVLVVEDHEDSREMLRALLEAEGHEVHEASDGRAAVEEALRWRPDVVLLDVGLPVLDGFEAARRIREGGGTMRLVALTGYGQSDDLARSREVGFDEHLVKPIDAKRVAQAVQTPHTSATSGEMRRAEGVDDVDGADGLAPRSARRRASGDDITPGK